MGHLAYPEPECSGSSGTLASDWRQLSHSQLVRAKRVLHRLLSPPFWVRSNRCAIAPMWLLRSRLTGDIVLGNYWVVAHEVVANTFHPESLESETKDIDFVQLVRLCMITDDRATRSRVCTAQEPHLICKKRSCHAGYQSTLMGIPSFLSSCSILHYLASCSPS